MAEILHKDSPALQQTTLDAFQQANTQQASLRRSFRLPIEYELVNSAQLESIFKNHGDGWLIFYRRFPGAQGVLTFSRAGFSADGTQALFYWSNSCGGLCGGSMFVVLEKRGGRWEIAQELEKRLS
jgi:hypothetical protein